MGRVEMVLSVLKRLPVDFKIEVVCTVMVIETSSIAFLKFLNTLHDKDILTMITVFEYEL